jgi:glycosyltransferase involved in cell wall biosynthesis
MLISFVIVSRSSDKRLTDTIESINKQTQDDHEVILVSDSPIQEGSTDYYLKELY